MDKKEQDHGEAFHKRLEGIIKARYTAAAIAVGGDLGLFEGMAKLDKPCSSLAIADALGYKER